jgi:hypothetical protein
MKSLAGQRNIFRGVSSAFGDILSRIGWRVALSVAGLLAATIIAVLPWESLGAPIAVFLVAGGFALALVYLDSNFEERPFAIRLFLVALGVHLVVICIFWIAAGGRQTYWLKDAIAYDRVGWAIAQAWQAGLAAPSGLGSLAWVANDTYPQLVGSFYFFTGHSPLTMLVFQAVLGASCVYLTYRIAAQILGSVTARLAGWLVLGYTGFLLYSIIVLKDSLALVFILVCFYAWYRIQQKVDEPAPWSSKIAPILFWAIIACAALLGVRSLRDYIAQIILGAWALGICHLLVRYSRRWWWVTLSAILVFVAVVVWWQFPNILNKSLPPVVIAPGSTLLTVVQTPVTETVKGLLHWIRTRTLSFSWFMLTASASTLIAPFAWIFPGMLPDAPHWSVYFVSYPGMWLWYLCIPFTIFGLFSSLRRTRGNVLPILFFALVMFLVFSLLIPRESRHRDMMMPIALILAAEGLVYARRWTWAGWAIWVPMAGFMAWKLGILLPASIAFGIIGLLVLVWLARRQRSARIASASPHP